MDRGDVEAALDRKVDFVLPLDAAVPQAVNQAKPAVLAETETPFSAAMLELARSIVGGERWPVAHARRPERRAFSALGGTDMSLQQRIHGHGRARRRRRPAGADRDAVVRPPARPFRRAAHVAARRVRDEGRARARVVRRRSGRAAQARAVGRRERARRGARSGSPRTSGSALVEAVVDDVLGYGPIDPFLRDDVDHRDHGERARPGVHRARGSASTRPTFASPSEDHLAARHRPDRAGCRAARRRGVADGRRRLARRLARERDHAAARAAGAGADDPQVLGRCADGGAIWSTSARSRPSSSMCSGPACAAS